ncbi:hypothetical protein BJ684DRAFT_18393 [Piptocephalis cylindrospora]|uniref:Uncharacterized protein n=1 Tax=Piptocephalis cylindrospora TaxID=1907219 RepID=A0A4P9Y8X8_9FUNG|nr:hypothetical protein BJ684DRAFT_18393 [Piptocephalis cylindrospora]|eukprot:RKP15274.1 hypothetical protein BJ684DRAFT_18393 [Piptocephalis cylindrospora]
MDLERDELYIPGAIGQTPCRWMENAKNCRNSVVYVSGYYISMVTASLALLLALGVFIRQSCHQHLGITPLKWPALLQFLLFYSIGTLLHLIHAVLILVNPPTSYAIREFFRIFAIPFVFVGLRPHLSGFVSIAASIDSDTLHYGMRQRTVQRLLHTIAPLGFLGSIVMVLSAWCVDQGWPMANRWLITVGCLIYILPCTLIGWCSYEYGIRFSYIIEAQLSEARAISSHFWNYTRLKAHDPESRLLIEVASALINMKSVHIIALIAAVFSVSHMIILAVAQVHIFRTPIFSEIIFFTYHVGVSLALLSMISYIFFQGFSCNARRRKEKGGVEAAMDDTCGLNGMSELETIVPSSDRPIAPHPPAPWMPHNLRRHSNHYPAMDSPWYHETQPSTASYWNP